MRLWTYASIFCVFLSGNSAALPASRDTTNSTLQSLSNRLPSCALQCFTNLAPKSKCELSDSSCFCTNPEFNEALSSCVVSKCSVRETLVATRIQRNACRFPIRDQSEVTRSVEWSFFGLAVVAVVLRFLARTPALGGTGYGWDDWSILACLALLVPLNAILNLMLDLGLGKDMWMLKPRDITSVLFYFWVEEFVYCATVLLTKISILLLYLRLFPETERWFRLACLGLISISAVTIIPVYLTILLQCNPINFAWLKWDGTHAGTCINTVAQIIALAGVNIILDLLVFLLPIPRLLKLNVSTSKKIAVVAVFLIGLFVTVCSVVRLQYLVQWGTSKNPTWQYNPLAVWSSIECNLGVALACMPSLAGPIKRVWKSTIRKQSASTESKSATRRKPSSSILGEVSHYFRSVPGSKPFSSFELSQRRFESTDEVELVDRDVEQHLRIHER